MHGQTDDAALWTLLRQHHEAVEAYIAAPSEPDGADAEAWNRLDNAENAIMAYQPVTAAGLRAKTRFLYALTGNPSGFGTKICTGTQAQCEELGEPNDACPKDPESLLYIAMQDVSQLLPII
jgi:hypothetical protein